MFYNVDRAYIHFLMDNTLKAIINLFFSNFFQPLFIDGQYIPLKLDSSKKGWMFDIRCESFLISLRSNMIFVWKAFFIFFIYGINCCFFVFIQSGDSAYNPPWHLWYLYYNEWKQAKRNSLFFIDVSNPIWYIEGNDWKRSSITSYSLPLIIIFTLSLFECITRSSSLS